MVDEVIGENKVEAVKVRNIQSGDITPVTVEGVFVYVGTRSNSELVKDIVRLNDRGYIIADENMGTGVPGLFVAGDVREKTLRQVVTATADGAIAAVEAEKYLAAHE